MEAWYALGVPLQVVQRAIDRFIERKKKAKRKRPFLLNHLEKDVERLFQQYQQLHVGSNDMVDSGFDFKARIKAFLRQLKKIEGEYPHLTSLMDIQRAMKEKRPDSFVTLEEAEAWLETLDQKLIEVFKEAIEPDTWERMERETSEFFDDDDPEELKANALNDLIRFHFSLPKLSVLG